MIAWRAGAILGVMLGVMVAAPTTASAHVALLFSSPSPDSVVVQSPAAVTLVFGEATASGPDAVVLTGPGAPPVRLGAPQVSDGARVLTVPVTGSLAPGIYSVHWTVTSGDGDLVDGTFRFGVGDATALASPSASSDIPWDRTLPVAALRWLLFTGLALALGGLAGERIAARTVGEGTRAWVVPGCLLVAAAGVGLAAVLAGAGGLGAIAGIAGVVLGLEVVAGLVAAALANTRLRGWTVLPLAAVIVAEAVRAHPREAIGAPGSLLTAAHLAAAAIWVGALVYVVRVGWRLRGDRSALARLLTGYAALALAALVVVVVTGILAAVALITLPELVATAYGWVLVGKVALVLVAIALAIGARTLLRRRRAPHAIRPARVEAVALLAVLALTGLLVSMPTPASGDAVLPFAPPPIGVVVPVATRAGQVAIAARASAGQLVVQLTAPGQDEQRPDTSTTNADATTYALTGHLAPGRQDQAPSTAVPLAFRSCGGGCFVAPAHWQPGVSVLTLAVSATGWTGGQAGLLVPWPGRDDPAALARTVEAMSAIPAFTLFEHVTSDTTVTVSSVGGLRLSGKRFIASEPYTGGAPIVTVIGDARPVSRILLGFPADNYTVDLRIDSQGRIQRETLVTGQHLVTRTFAYSE